MTDCTCVRLQIPWPTLLSNISVHTTHFTLEIPIFALSRNTKHPRKQGTLCLLDGLPLDNTHLLSGVLPDEVYSFRPAQDVKRTLCDLKGGDDRTSIFPEDNTRPGDLRNLISERGSHRCVLVKPLPLAVKYPGACQATHLLPHSKGDEVCSASSCSSCTVSYSFDSICNLSSSFVHRPVGQAHNGYRDAKYRRPQEHAVSRLLNSPCAHYSLAFYV